MRIRHPNRPRKIKDKKSGGCAMCKPHKHGWRGGRKKPLPPIMDGFAMNITEEKE